MGEWRWRLSLRLRSGTQAAGAHLHLLLATVGAVDRNPLNVHVPAPVRLVVRVAHVVAELGASAADVALRHGYAFVEFSGIVERVESRSPRECDSRSDIVSLGSGSGKVRPILSLDFTPIVSLEVGALEPTSDTHGITSGGQLRELFLAATDWLETNVPAVNALNVFPVPDGDTGTNMLLTLRSGHRHANEALDESSAFGSGRFAAELARGALMGARGNSGVILSQYLNGFARALEGVSDASPTDLARALTGAADAAYGAMSSPVEGTILTVARAAADGASSATGGSDPADPAATLLAAAEAAEAAVEQTPQLLPVLADAGVVDSGGQGLALLLRAMTATLSGDDLGPPIESTEPVTIDQSWLANQQQEE